jgi:hypothetical protein
MIQANNLRIGNWVMNQSGYLNDIPIGKPVQIDIDGFRWASFYLPIPLTEEWLLKFGFIKDEWGAEQCGSVIGDLYVHDLIQICIVDGVFYSYVHIDDDSYYSFKDIELPYVHSLQNYVHARTNTELTVPSDWDNLPFKD